MSCLNKDAVADTSWIAHLDEDKSAKIVYKRRSTIFRRQSITTDQQQGDNKVMTNNIEFALDKNEGDKQADVETFNLEEYIEKLKQEREDWLQEYRKRRDQRKDLTKEKTKIESQGQLLDINVLTESEKAFIISRPNYEYICKNSEKLSDVALKITTLSQVVHKLNQRFMERMEDNISRVTRDVIKMSKH